jgi:hypothetical protein
LAEPSASAEEVDRDDEDAGDREEQEDRHLGVGPQPAGGDDRRDGEEVAPDDDPDDPVVGPLRYAVHEDVRHRASGDGRHANGHLTLVGGVGTSPCGLTPASDGAGR